MNSIQKNLLPSLAMVLAAALTACGGGGNSYTAPPPMTPRATLRLQFHHGFTFADAEALVPYFARLGVSHIYASPLMQARPGSTHGYDIVGHDRLNPEIGSDDDLAGLTAALKAHDMGLIVDIVPTHPKPS